MLTNDKGKTESDPFDYYAGRGDLQSWGRVHKSIRASVGGVLNSTSQALPNAGEARQWVEVSEKYSDLAIPGLGFEYLYNFGSDGLDQAAIVEETIDSAKEGQRLLGILRGQAGIEGGEDSSGVDPAPQPKSDVKAFIGGAVVLGLAYGVWRVSRDLKD